MNEKIIKSNSLEKGSLSPGLKGLELHVDRETFIYILRSVYNIIFKSSKLKEDKKQLKKRIKKFEEQSDLPCFMSEIPIEDLLSQLEDAQYFYMIRRQEITLPTFH